MKRTLLVLTLLAAAGLAGGCRPATRAGAPADSVPSLRVERGPFRHVVTAEGLLEAVESTPVTVPKSSRRSYTIAWVAPDASRVKEGDVVVRFERTELESELEDGRADLGVAEQRLDKEQQLTSSALRNLDRDIEMARARLAAAREFRPKDAELFSRNDIITGEIDAGLAERRAEHSTTARRRKEAEAERDLELLLIERRKAENDIERAEEGLSATEVRAPHDGILLLERNWRGEVVRAGQSVWQGQKLASIPDLSTMKAEVHVLEADAGGLEAGRRARLLVEAHPEKEFEAVIARVDDLARPRVPGSPVQYFGVTLDLRRTDPELMKPGQRVRAELELLELEEVIAIPRQAVFQQDGETVAWVLRGAGLESVPIELGEGTPGRVVVRSGLEEGDRIALRDPEDAQS